MKNISILGSTGSIGTSTLDVIARHPDQFKVVGLAAGSNLDALAAQIEAFHPAKVSVRHRDDVEHLRQRCRSWSGKIVYGESGAVEVATDAEADLVVSSIVGAAGLVPTYESLRSGIDVALANKESLVIAGKVMTEAARKGSARLLPVDSEHSAIFQALAGNDPSAVKRIGLTASGGPFRETAKEDFAHVTVEQALKHPNWSMGAKITIDSATMMNKGLEVIEATWLFGYAPDKIQILVHPQSVVHSMVEYIDGSVMAQLGVPDMRCAIAYALAYPDRITTGVDSLNLFEIQSLTFSEPDFEKFSTLRLAYEAAVRGESYPALLNAANEIAVEAFLQGRIKFHDIFSLLESAFDAHDSVEIQSIDDVIAVDDHAREKTRELLVGLAA